MKTNNKVTNEGAYYSFLFSYKNFQEIFTRFRSTTLGYEGLSDLPEVAGRGNWKGIIIDRDRVIQSTDENMADAVSGSAITPCW